MSQQPTNVDLLEDSAQKSAERRVRKSMESFESEATTSKDSLSRYVNRAIQLGRADLAAEIVEAESIEEPQFILERIIDESQLTGVAFFYRGIHAARAVGRIVVNGGTSFGTGFMISQRLMMTNNHVLSNAATAAASVIEFDFAKGLSGKLMTRKVFRLEPSTFFQTSRQIDYTIVAVESVNEQDLRVEDRGWLHLIRESGKAVVGERLNIIQHPDAKPQMIALRENTLIGVEGFFLHYKTDTRPGSSGSPVMNDQFQLAALHHAGVPARDNGGNILKRDGTRFRTGDDPTEISWIANEGARVSQIVKDMSNRDLSQSEDAEFQRAFEEPPLPTGSEASLAGASGLGPSPTAFGSSDRGNTARNDPSSPVSIDENGIARWNFQLTFGPMGANTSTPVAQQSAPIQNPPLLVKSQQGSIVIATGSTTSEDDEYYDENADEQAATRYYEEIDDESSPKELFYALQQLVTNTHTTQFSYKTARHDHLYPTVDRHPDNSLRSVYSDDIVPEEMIRAELMQFERAVAEVAAREGLEASDLPEDRLDEIDLILESSGPFNCEHVVPQSWFDKKQPMKADLHHLFTCEPKCNSFRSNIPYWEFAGDEAETLRMIEVASEALEDLSQEGTRPACGIRDGRKFEPEANKGAAARATLYFLLRYPGQVGDVKSGPKLELTKSRLDILLQWAEEDEPSLWEKHRNAEIAKAQGNRNPLIDNPHWLRSIDFNLGFG